MTFASASTGALGRPMAGTTTNSVSPSAGKPASDPTTTTPSAFRQADWAPTPRPPAIAADSPDSDPQAQAMRHEMSAPSSAASMASRVTLRGGYTTSGSGRS